MFVLSGLALAQPRSATFTLTWTDRSDNETGFNLYRKTGTTSTKIGNVGANATSFVTAPIVATEGSQVCFAVTAFNAAGESAPNEACGTIPTTAVTSLPLIMESKVLPEYGAISLTLAKPAGATKATLVMDVYDPDYADEGELWINDRGPIALFGAAGNSGNQQKVATVEYDIPLAWFIDGANKLRFSHGSTDGYKINSAAVRFEMAAAPGAPTALTVKAN